MLFANVFFFSFIFVLEIYFKKKSLSQLLRLKDLAGLYVIDNSNLIFIIKRDEGHKFICRHSSPSLYKYCLARMSYRGRKMKISL